MHRTRRFSHAWPHSLQWFGKNFVAPTATAALFLASGCRERAGDSSSPTTATSSRSSSPSTTSAPSVLAEPNEPLTIADKAAPSDSTTATEAIALARSYTLKDETGREVGYRVFLPQGFSADKTYPAIISSGDTEANAEQEAEPSFAWHEHPHARGWILIQTPEMFNGSAKAGAQGVRAIVKDVLAKFQVEGGKVHAVGWSRGSAPAYQRVLASPELFHSISGIPGFPAHADAATTKRLQGLTVMFVTGSKDAYWLKGSRDADATFKKAGIDTIFEVVEGAGHVMRELSDGGFFVYFEKVRAASQAK